MRRKGFEPLTPRFEVWCSIQLSYRRWENCNGAPEEIRTPDPQIRSLVLYPAELRARETAGPSGNRRVTGALLAPAGRIGKVFRAFT